MRWLAYTVSIIAYLVASGMLTEVGWAVDGLVRYGLCAVLLFLVVLVHEVGHALVAHRVGAEVRSIMVWPFELRLRPRKFGMAKQRRSGDVGGYVAFRLDRIGASRKHMSIAAAGPLANLISAAMVIAIVALASSQAHFAEARSFLPILANAFGTLSIGVGLANLLPFAGSDGMVLWRGARARTRFSRR